MRLLKCSPNGSPGYTLEVGRLTIVLGTTPGNWGFDVVYGNKFLFTTSSPVS